jgi:hypothetical protein
MNWQHAQSTTTATPNNMKKEKCNYKINSVTPKRNQTVNKKTPMNSTDNKYHE